MNNVKLALFLILALILTTVSCDPPNTPPNTGGQTVQDTPTVRGFTPSVSTRPVSPSPATTATTEPPTAIVEPTATHTPTPIAPNVGDSAINGWATHYGERFNGQTMACGGTYQSNDPDIVAVAYPARNLDWPCGTRLRITGPGGTLETMRTDSCPGCGPNHVDLSEAGSLIVCGRVGNCDIRIEVLK